MNHKQLLRLAFVSSCWLLTGCTPHSDAMAGWKELGAFSEEGVPQTIKRDALAYFSTLPDEERESIEYDWAVRYWEGENGQHAAVLEAPHDGEYWSIALIYDRDNHRLRVLKYSTGSFTE